MPDLLAALTPTATAAGHPDYARGAIFNATGSLYSAASLAIELSYAHNADHIPGQHRAQAGLGYRLSW